jgi:pimeloyl-ACP methyl ester carboxylesterase
VVNEQAVVFDTAQGLAAIITPPAGAPTGLGVVFVNAGVVHRVGPSRMYVRAARALAAQGWVAARVDLSGLGDSPTRRDPLPFEQAAVAETRAVMSSMQATHGVRGFVLAGLCSGAIVAFRTAVADDRVAGAVLINPQGFGSDATWNGEVLSRGRARRFLRKALSPRSWRRAFSGQSDYRLALKVAGERLEALLGRDAAVTRIGETLATDFGRLTARGVRLLLTCSDGDYAFDYLEAILGSGLRRLGPPQVQLHTLPAGDHSLTMQVSQESFLGAVTGWAADLAEAQARAAVGSPALQGSHSLAVVAMERGR